MKKQHNNTLIEHLVLRVEQGLCIALETFQNLEPSILLHKPSEGGWSIAQSLEHLNSYGRFYLPEIQSALDKNQGKSEIALFKSGWLGQYFTQMMRPASRKKYKAFKNHIPSDTLNAHAVVAAFIEQQETLLRYLEHAKTTDLNHKIPISITPWIKLKLGDVFQFLIAHQERHLEQAKRNLR